MPTMILSHPRSMSTVFASHFPDYRGEVFEQRLLKSSSFYGKHPDLYEQDIHEFMVQYLEDFRNSIGPTTTFKVHYHQLLKWRDAASLVDTLNLDVIAIERLDRFAALKSFFIGLRKGFYKTVEKQIEPFHVSRSEFDACREIMCERYQEGLEKFKPGIVVHGEYWEKSIKLLGLPTKTDLPEKQNSAQSENLILNLSEVEQWWQQRMVAV